MLDALNIAITLMLFVVSGLYVCGCRSLKGGGA